MKLSASLERAYAKMPTLALYEHTRGDDRIQQLFGLELLCAEPHQDFFAKIALNDASMSTTQRRIAVRYQKWSVAEFDNTHSYPFDKINWRSPQPWAKHTLGEFHAIVAPWLIRNKAHIEAGHYARDR